jgi:hypothetical protein
VFGICEDCTDGVQWRMKWTKSVPSELPTCPATASMLSGLAVEPILDFLSDRL